MHSYLKTLYPIISQSHDRIRLNTCSLKAGATGYLLLFLCGMLFWISIHFLLLYFFRKQRDHSPLYLGAASLFTGARASVFIYGAMGTLAPSFEGFNLLPQYFFFSVLAALFTFYSLERKTPLNQPPWLRVGVTVISLTTLFLSIKDLSGGAYRWTIILFNLVMLILFIHMMVTGKDRKKIPLLMAALVFQLLYPILFAYDIFHTSTITVVSEITGMSVIFLISLDETRKISRYFSRVEDLSYDLKVMNATLRKSEETVKLKNRELSYQAGHDFLTRLPNRLSLYNSAEENLKHSQIRGKLVALILIDLDHFKQLNDSMGHLMGDKLLTRFAELIRSALRSSDCLYRLGGDEFTIMLTELESEEDLFPVITKIYRILEQPVSLGTVEYFISSSMGAALFPGHGRDIDTLLGKADIALYRAKEEGRNKAVLFRPEMQNQSDSYFNIQKIMPLALENNQFFLLYQPQYDYRNNRLMGLEVLVRLQGNEGEVIPPDQFIPIAEDSGFIINLGAWIIRSACTVSRSWLALIPDLMISINISFVQFRQDSFISDLDRILQETGFPPENLILEMTENVVMKQDGRTIDKLKALKQRGIAVSIDDFGTGYSSINYLKNFPLDHLKIDKSFVEKLPESREDRAIVSSFIAMADSFGMQVVAEGIERTEQIDFLLEQGCSLMQGYLIGLPERASVIEKYLNAQKGVIAI